MEPRGAIPWILGLIVFPILGAVGWIGWSVLTPSSPDSAFNQGALEAMPYILAFVGPPLATIIVAAQRDRLPSGLLLALAAPPITLAVLALVLVTLFAIGCSRQHCT